jgi:hypothetical protein
VSRMYPGPCSLHQQWADDVELIQAQDQGSGFAGGRTYGCLPCLQPLVEHPHASKRVRAAFVTLQRRAAQRACERLLDGGAPGSEPQTRADLDLLAQALPQEIKAVREAIREAHAVGQAERAAAQTELGEAERRVAEGTSSRTRSPLAQAQRLARMHRSLNHIRARLPAPDEASRCPFPSALGRSA